ncbi:b(0,+)-type amino acid transporter 1-like [Ylistrum balloti]|uniref:b(0,+)-type amino acid transporter 1-like n=1 Tax=Ylistrum balloti TaxID=509963 RepID=UPI002905C03E|nr:b(0,+)-type amino acid transporter 1-like [Ylistrum balloti]
MRLVNRSNSSSTDSDSSSGEVKLKKSVGLFTGVGLIVGSMIGSGIFISPKGILEGTGSIAMSLIIWALCGLVVTLGALSYAEMGTAIPKSGGEHSYLMFTYGHMSKLGAIPSFIFDWVSLFIIRPTQFALISLSLGTYVAKPFFPDCDPPLKAVKLITAVAMLLVTFINITSVKVAVWLQSFCTIAKLLAIAMISFGGLYKLITDGAEHLGEGFEGTSENVGLIAIAFYNGLWAFDGWNNLNLVTEELKSPQKNLPLAIIIGIPMTTACYLLANVGYFAVMSKHEVLESHAVAVTWGDHMLGVMSWTVPLFVVISCLGAANGCLFATSRLVYVAARGGNFPQVLSFINMTRLTPLPSVLFTSLVGFAILIPGDISTLMDFYGFSAWFIYSMTIFSVLVLRYTQPNLHRPYKVPIIIPVFVFLIASYLLISPVIQSPRVQFIYACIFIASGMLFYFPFVYMKVQVPYMDKFSTIMQKTFLIVPGKADS